MAFYYQLNLDNILQNISVFQGYTIERFNDTITVFSINPDNQ